MKTLLVLFTFLLLAHFTSVTSAASDPRTHTNNSFGIHLLFPSELDEAAKLVNSNGGEWGYVIIPIQSGDKDREKWQSFLDEAGEKKLTPILRLATEGDYFNTKVWRKPRHEDVLDFANFLHSLDWPMQNKYIVVFNEVYRGDEWGGTANPAEYAELLSYAVTVFKSRSQDFFIIGGGFDNAAPNQGTEYIDQYSYMTRMNEAVPGIFNQIDGFASHSYPNPGFSQPPSVVSSKSISSFDYERSLLQKLSSRSLPIFITETGWSLEGVSDEARAQYYETAFTSVWSDKDIVAVIPFVLRAAAPFAQFSFINEDGSPTEQYKKIQSMKKNKGTPPLSQKVLSVQDPIVIQDSKKFIVKKEDEGDFSPSSVLRATFEWIMRI